MILKIEIQDWLHHYEPFKTLTVENSISALDIFKVTKAGNIHFTDPVIQARAIALFFKWRIAARNGIDVTKQTEGWEFPAGIKLIFTAMDGCYNQVFITDGDVTVENSIGHTQKQIRGCFVKRDCGNFYPIESTPLTEFDFDPVKKVFVKKQS